MMKYSVGLSSWRWKSFWPALIVAVPGPTGVSFVAHPASFFR